MAWHGHGMAWRTVVNARVPVHTVHVHTAVTGALDYRLLSSRGFHNRRRSARGCEYIRLSAIQWIGGREGR